MATTRTSTYRRHSLRAAALALVTGAGIVLTPVPASANAGAAPVASPVAVAAAARVAAPTNAARIAVRTALAQRGKPYVWGGTGPRGYDCSGLTFAAYRAAGKPIPRTSRAQSTVGKPVARANLRPGDLIFFYRPVSHVGMYIGNGLMVHSSTYGKPVAVVPVAAMRGYNSARRVA